MIPKKINYVWIKGGENYKILQDSFLENDYVTLPKEYEFCILSAYVMNPDYELVLHSNAPLKSELLFKIPNFKNEIISQDLWRQITEVGLANVSHCSDYLRYTILKEEGGIYSDTDILCIKSFDDLLDTDKLILAKEKPTTCCCAVMLTEKENPIIKDTLNEYHIDYRPEEWLYNAQKVLLNNTKKFSENVKILNYEEGFFYPNWKPYPMGMFYDTHLINSKEDIQQKFKGYTHHFWGSTPYGDRLKEYIRDVCLPNINNPNETYISQLCSFIYKEFNKLVGGNLL